MKFRITLGALLVFVLIGYLWNVVHYNTWWAYDGGAHLGYIFSLAETGHLPTPVTNYIAWHEPLYYVLSAMVVRLCEFGGVAEPLLNKILQIGSALIVWSMIVAAALLAWLMTRKQWIVGVTTLIMSGLFVVSALARYVTNEGLFQALVLWWLVWWYAWRMEIETKNDVQRWMWLSLGLLLIVWVKLTGLVLVLAVLLWLGVTGWRQKTWRPLSIAFVVVGIVGVGFSPWLLHKERVYGHAFTINNYETKDGTLPPTHLPDRFFVSIDTTVFTNPFWRSGRQSFWSMVYASTLGDYDNIFQNYEARTITPTLQTDNGRLIAITTAHRTRFLLWWSMPLVLLLLFGLGRLLLFTRHNLEKWLLPFFVAGGLVAALMYNVHQYPFLDRGTLKAIFVVSAFPLLTILACMGWDETKKNLLLRFFSIACGAYLLLWWAISWSIILLPR